MRALACVATCLVLAGPLAAQGDDPRLAARLDAPTRAAVSRTIAEARDAGLPVEPLVDKALEGASRGVPGPRIVAAVDRLAADLTHARSALGTRASGGELVAAAAALRAGASEQGLAAIGKARAAGGLTVPLATLADLVARGVPVETASSVVLGLAERGVSDAGFVALRQTVERDINAGVPPAAAASVRGQGQGPPESVVPPGRGGEKDKPGRGRGRGNSSG